MGKEQEMSTSIRRVFSREFKGEAVREVLDSKRSIADVAKSLDLPPQTLGNWVRAHKESIDSTGKPIAVEERAEVKKLQRENAELREQLSFMEKAVAFFAQKRR
jgi:transposase